MGIIYRPLRLNIMPCACEMRKREGGVMVRIVRGARADEEGAVKSGLGISELP